MVFANIPACRYPYGMANGSFMENLRQLMAGRGLTISELARKSGVSYQQISYYLTGDPRAKSPAIHNLVKLAKALHCDLEALTGHISTHFRPSPKPVQTAVIVWRKPLNRCKLWGIRPLPKKWRPAESNRGHTDFQSVLQPMCHNDLRLT